MPNQINKLFPDFEYPAKDILKYIESAGIFKLLLRNQNCISFEPSQENVAKFHAWLKSNQVQDIKESPSWVNNSN